jgi:hypothetical protein
MPRQDGYQVKKETAKLASAPEMLIGDKLISAKESEVRLNLSSWRAMQASCYLPVFPAALTVER